MSWLLISFQCVDAKGEEWCQSKIDKCDKQNIIAHCEKTCGVCQVDTTVATTTMAADNTTTPSFNETTTADEETTTPSGETTPDPVSEVYWNNCIEQWVNHLIFFFQSTTQTYLFLI